MPRNDRESRGTSPQSSPSPPPLRALLTALLLAALPVASAAAAAGQPAGAPPATVVQNLIEAFNGGDPAAFAAYLKAHATAEWLAEKPAGERLVLFTRMMQDLGRLEVATVRASPGGGISVHARSERLDTPVRLELDFESAAPFRLRGLGVEVSEEPESDLPELPELAAGTRPGTLSEASRAALDRYFLDLSTADRFSGTVLLAIDGRPVYEGAYGLADRDWAVANRMGTRFDLGSINKELTKVAVGQLLQAGELGLDDTIQDLLPDYPNPEVGRRVTVAQLLDHTSGLGDIFGPPYFRANKADFRTNRDYLPLFAEQPLLFEPGTSRRYSNAGYVVLGAIVAEVSGVPYAEYVAHHVFDPAGMTGAAFAARDEIRHDVAVGYTVDDEGRLRPNTFMVPVVGMGAGSAVATAGDLLAFDRALRQHRLLDPRYTEWFFTGILPAEGATAPDPAPADEPIGVAGGAPGVNAILEGDGRHSAIVLSNIDPPAAETLGIELARRLAPLVPERGSGR